MDRQEAERKEDGLTGRWTDSEEDRQEALGRPTRRRTDRRRINGKMDQHEDGRSWMDRSGMEQDVDRREREGILDPDSSRLGY